MKSSVAQRRTVACTAWAVCVLLVVANAVADECPYAALTTNSSATTALGAWGLQAWSPRMDFPKLQDKADVRMVRPGIWGMPVKCDASVTPTSNGLNIRVAGYRNEPEADGWIPMVTFTPTAEGSYEFFGHLKFWFNGDTNATDAVQWAVVSVAQGLAIKPLAGDKVGHGAIVKLSALPALRAVQLGAGESVGILVWRPTHRYACGATLTRFIVKASAAAAK